jgi:hypothetical protein
VHVVGLGVGLGRGLGRVGGAIALLLRGGHSQVKCALTRCPQVTD